MAGAVGDILQVTMDGIAGGEPTSNVYYYRLAGTVFDTDYLEAFIDAWSIAIPAPLLVVSTNNTAFTNYSVKNLTNGLDFRSETASGVGAIAGANLPPQNVFTVRLIRSTLATRNGAKRYSGLAEAAVTDLGVITWIAGQKTNIENGHAQTLNVNTLGNTFTAQPVIVGRIHQGLPGAGGLDLSVINPVAAAQAGNKVASQVSRKYRQTY